MPRPTIVRSVQGRVSLQEEGERHQPRRRAGETPGEQRCQETVGQGQTSSGQGSKTDCSTLKPSSLASCQDTANAQRSTDRSTLKPRSLASRQETISQGQTSRGQECRTDRSTLKPGSLASCQETVSQG